VLPLALSTRRALAVVLAVLVLGILAARHFAGAGAATATARPPARLTAAVPAPRPRVVVHVVGAVRRPGLYRLADGSRIADAVDRAGGATPNAALDLVNLAAPLADGAQVVVPRRAPAEDAGAATPPAADGAPAAKVSLNRATLEELDALPGIGPATAQRILAYRQEHGAIGSVDELDAVPGIGPARLEQLRELVAP
jgi:competence protein ComEA